MASEIFNFTSSTFLSLKEIEGNYPAGARAWTILETNSYPRRLYGFTVTPQTTNSIKLQFWVSNVSPNSFEYDPGDPSAAKGYRFFSTEISGGNQHVPHDIFLDEKCAAIFQRQRDHKGVPYFHVPAGWVFGVRHSTLDAVVYTLHGEIYGA